jgi:endoglycosylceramidase
MAPRASGAAGRALVAGLAALAFALAGPAWGAGKPPPGYGSVGRWIVDPQGRVFVPHGLNLVVTRPPYWSSWFSEQDARFVASQGFTAMRINVIPEALEPRLGHVDATYLGHFAVRQSQLARHGIATLLTLNQDDYSSRCGGNGFPSWAVLAPCAEPWAPFWADDAAADGAGLQAHFLSWWSRLAGRFAGVRGLLGYDLLNEPEAADDATLGDLLRRTVATVREVDARRLAHVLDVTAQRMAEFTGAREVGRLAT